MVGSSIWRHLENKGYSNLIGRSSKQLDLKDQEKVFRFFKEEKPDYVFIAAAKVGGILANKTFKADFIFNNIQIQNNIIHCSHVFNIKKLLFLGSSCIYPRNCPQPMKEKYLLTGGLEKTNESYAIAKISGIKMCESYNFQYGTNFISIMPTNLYGPNDNFDLKTSHVLPALIRKIFIGKCLEESNINLIKKDLNKNSIDGLNGSESKNKILEILKKNGFSFKIMSSGRKIDSNSVEISLWGTGEPFREFLHVDDLAKACVFAMKKINYSYFEEEDISHLNVGSSEEIKIKDLSSMIKKIIGFKGKIIFDTSSDDGAPRKLLDTSKLNGIGWKSQISLKTGIKSTFLYYKSFLNNKISNI